MKTSLAVIVWVKKALWIQGIELKENAIKKKKLEQTCYIFAMSHPQRLGQKYDWKK